MYKIVEEPSPKWWYLEYYKILIYVHPIFMGVSNDCKCHYRGPF